MLLSDWIIRLVKNVLENGDECKSFRFFIIHRISNSNRYHCQTTNFGPSQIERVISQQFEMGYKTKKREKANRYFKPVGENVKLLVTSNFSFSLNVFIHINGSHFE